MAAGGGDGPSGEGNVDYLSLPGTNGNYVSTPDSEEVSITGDIDMRMKVALTDWTPTLSGLVSKYLSTGNQESWRWYVYSAGMQIDISSNGSAESGANVGPMPFGDGETGWVQVTWRKSDRRTQFFTSSDGAAWDQLGTDQTTSGSGIFDSTSQLVLGSLDSGGSNWNLNGKIYYFELRDGIDGTVVSKFDSTDVTRTDTRTPTTWEAPTGETWTVNGSAWDWVLE